MNLAPETVRTSFASDKTRNMVIPLFSFNKGSALDLVGDVLHAVNAGAIKSKLFESSSPQNIAASAAANQQR